MKHDVIVVGAGAAGLLAAGTAAESGAKVLVIEHMRHAGRKLLISGKGRCNITNLASLENFIESIHPDGRFLRPAFKQFFSGDIIRLLNNCGVDTITERGERVFPASGKSMDVLKALIRWNEHSKVEFLFETRVTDLLINEGKVYGVTAESDGKPKKYLASAVIICTGGKSYPATGSTGDGYTLAINTGHQVEPVRQALVPLVTEGDIAPRMQGISLKNVKAVLKVNGTTKSEDFGEMLFTHFGLSGPIILKLSRHAVDALRLRDKVEVILDLKPALDEQKLDLRLIRDLNENGKKNLENILKLWLPSGMIPVFLDILSLAPLKKCHQVDAQERKKILQLLKSMTFKITGCRSFREAIITAGGIKTDQVNPKTMESKLIKNLFFAGEILDIDADTGGFNLQVAWSTGYVAGFAAASVKNNIS
jgi:predicted Rossmann fold flavoprotein